VDERSDIFSAGVVAYELLGGTRPFAGDSYSTVLRAILTLDPPELSHFNPLVPEEVAAVVRKMLAKDVGKRYANIAQAREELEGIIEQLGLLRGKDLLKEYASSPEVVGQKWRQKRLSRHLDQGLFFENMGLGKIDDALLEFRRVLHLDPNNAVAKDHLKKLERERDKVAAQKPQAAPALPANEGATMVMTPEEAAAQAAAPPRAPAPAPPKAAAPAPAKSEPKPAAKPEQRPAPKPAAAKPVAAKKGGLPMPALAGIIVGVIAIAAAAIFMLNRQPEVGATDTLPSSDEPVATSTDMPESGTMPDVESPPAVPPGVAPALTPAQAESVKAVAARAKAVRDSIAAAKAAAKAALATADPAPAGDATVIVTASPFANFTVDGTPRTQNARSWRGKLPPGKHTVVIEHPTLGKHEWPLELAAGETKELDYDFLAASAGSISISSEGGWAEIYLDGDRIGHPTPWVITGVLPGRHEVSLVREGYSVDGGAKTVTVKAGQETKVSFKVKAKK